MKETSKTVSDALAIGDGLLGQRRREGGGGGPRRIRLYKVIFETNATRAAEGEVNDYQLDSPCLLHDVDHSS